MKLRDKMMAIGASALVLAALPATPSVAAPGPNGVQIIYSRIYPAVAPTPAQWDVFVSANVPCPAGSKVVGSGSGPHQVTTFPSKDSSQATVVGYVAYNDNPYHVGEIVCAPASQFSNVTVQKASPAVTPLTWTRNVVMCPAGSYAFGGGGGFFSAGQIMVREMDTQSNGPTLDGRGWEFTGFVPSSASTLQLITHCAPRTGHDLLATAYTPAQTANAQNVTTYAYCPPGYQVIAGGFHVLNADGTPFVPVPNQLPSVLNWSIPVPPSDGNGSSWYANMALLPANTRLLVTAQCVN